jgi:hypothetical protein
VATDPYPRSALDANRSGRLTPEQATLYRAEAATDRRNLLFGGIAVIVFGAAILFGAITGRIPGGRLEPLLVGAAILAFGVAMAYFGGIRGSAAKAAAANAGRVTSLEGPFRRERRDRRDDTDHVSPGNEYEYYLLVGERSFTVSRDQWEAAPEDGVVRVYLLGDSSRIVNLEKTAEAPPPQVPAMVRSALERASASGDPARAAQAQALLRQADAMSGAADGAPGPRPAAPAGPLEQAILGSWRNDLMGITYEFRAGGSAVATLAIGGTHEQRWSVAGPDAIRLDDETLHASVAGSTLSIGEPGQPLPFTRVS